MAGGVIETDVVLDADGAPLNAAFGAVHRHIERIQGSFNKLQTQAQAITNAFGGGMQKAAADLNKTVSTFEKLEGNIAKAQQALYSNSSLGKNDNQVRAIRQRMAEEEKAWQQLDSKKAAAADKRAKQEASMWAAQDRTVSADVARQEKTKERLATQRWERERTAEVKADRERERLAQQNRFKIGRDKVVQDVSAARTVVDLENQRLVAADRITRARAMLNKFGAEEDRQLLSIIANEKARYDLAERRIKAEQNAKTKTQNSDASVDGRLNVRSARIAEQNSAATMNLGAAKARQAQLEADIVAQIAKAKTLTGLQKVEAERLLRADEARLQVINRRVNALQREHNAMVQSAQPKPGQYGPPMPPGMKSPGSPGGGEGGGNGLFGAAGLGGVFLRTAAYGGAAAAIYGTIAAFRDGVTAAILFEDQMAKISAVAGLTSTQNAALAQSIRDVAANSRFATDEIAEATMVLAQAGFSATDIGDSLQNVANLAAAAGVSFSEATDVVTGAIGAFQLQTSETGHIADVLSAALNTTKLNIQQVALGIQYAGATAFENKISFDELTATLATMAQAGIRSGSTMGTGLRQLLVDLQTPTKKMAEEFKRLGISMKDIDIKTLGLPEVLKRLADAGFAGASAYGTLETRAAAAYMVLKNNQELLNKQIILQNQLGNAAEAAAKGQESLTAEWQRFKNQLNENVAEKFAPIGGAIKDLLHSFNELGGNQDLRKMREELNRLEEDSDAWAAQIDAIEAYKAALRENLEIVDEHAGAIEDAQTATNEANEAFAKAETTVNAATDSIGKLIQREKTLKAEKGALGAETATLMARFEGLAAQVFRLGNSYDGLLASMRAVRAEQIAMGALQANAQAISADNRARAYGGRAQSTANQIIASGLYARLPKDIQQAMTMLARNPDAEGAGTWSRMITDYANRTKGLKGYEADRLRLFSSDASRTGLAKIDRADARKRQDIMGHLGTDKGQDWLKRIDNLTGKDDATIKATIADIANHFGDGKSESVQGVGNMLMQMATSKLGSGSAPSAPASSSRSGSNRAERDADRRQQQLMRLRMKATEAELKQALKGITDQGGGPAVGDNDNITIAGSKGLTKEQLLKNLARVDTALEKWIKDRTDQVKADIDASNMSPEEADLAMQELAREIEAKKEETARAVDEGLTDAMQAMVDTITEAAEKMEMEADQALALVEARLRSLDRQNLRGYVPDYVRANAERAAGAARDQRDMSQIAINNKTIDKLQDRQSFWEGMFDEVRAKEGAAGVVKLQEQLDALDLQIIELTNSNEALKASFMGGEMIPQSIGDAWRAASQNWLEANRGMGDLTNTIKMNLGGAIDTVAGSMEELFTNIMSGTMTAREAFRAFIQSIIGYLVKLIAKMIVVKLLQMALGMAGGGGTADGTGVGAPAGMESFYVGIGQIHGGEIKRSGGGRVENGVPSRDSVRTRLAKGEFVMRKWAVDSLGVDFMARLNNRGKDALAGMSPKVLMPPPARQEMKVFVVANDDKPQMGPNDVLVTIADDIRQGGVTKQLIKHVSQGG